MLQYMFELYTNIWFRSRQSYFTTHWSTSWGKTFPACLNTLTFIPHISPKKFLRNIKTVSWGSPSWMRSNLNLRLDLLFPHVETRAVDFPGGRGQSRSRQTSLDPSFESSCRHPSTSSDRTADMALSGKTAVVTGAVMGIGRAMTEVLLQNGAKVKFCPAFGAIVRTSAEVHAMQQCVDR